MHIAGITKNTLLDYPGRVAAAIFTGGCDLRCLFCQNSSLVEGLIPEIKEEDVLSFLEKRRNNLTGVCITGGEPTLQPDLPDFIMKVRDLGYAVKVDTNGTEPKMLRELADRKLVDYVALDIKTGRKQYRELCNIDLDVERVDDSAKLLIDGRFPDYEFRTTVVAEYFDRETAKEIGQWLKGARRYFLQNFVDTNTTFVGRGVLHGQTKEEIEAFAEILRQTISEVSLRGID
ncbi:MAG: anaerobic ribonucleoside-triphosphate reductase activating protein [Lachnospiraceae bacterium]|nr:anaerobic ribonucleoside-triphosphate reductase activating protein [Lachnospiraceae bacterium]